MIVPATCTQVLRGKVFVVTSCVGGKDCDIFVSRLMLPVSAKNPRNKFSLTLFPVGLTPRSTMRDQVLADSA